jgi:hypothetical protein
MTTRIKITNEGPENAGVWYYDRDRKFKEHADHLKPGESIEMDVWDGHLPLVLPLGHVQDGHHNTSCSFYSVPPAQIEQARDALALAIPPLRHDSVAQKLHAAIAALDSILAAPDAQVAPAGFKLEGWRIRRLDSKPFSGIEFIAPNGYSTAAYSHARNPENILFMLGDALLEAAPAPSTAQAAQTGGQAK